MVPTGLMRFRQAHTHVSHRRAGNTLVPDRDITPFASWIVPHPCHDHIKGDRATLTALTACLSKNINVSIPISMSEVIERQIIGSDLEEGTPRL